MKSLNGSCQRLGGWRAAERILNEEIVMKDVLKTTAIAAGTVLAMAGGASAATLIFTGSGNDPFPRNLVISDQGIDSAGLAKCDTETNGNSPVSCGAWEDGNADGDYTGAFELEYTLTVGTGYAFTWSFDPDLVIGTTAVLFPHYLAVKQASGFDVWALEPGEVLGGTIQTTLNDISHVSFFNSEPAVIPLPAAGWLLLAGVGGLAAVAHRRKAAA
jgi:hypothetical protein